MNFTIQTPMGAGNGKRYVTDNALSLKLERSLTINVERSTLLD